MATKTRISKKVITNVTIEQAQDAANRYTSLQNKLSGIESKMNLELQKVKDKYADDITSYQEELKPQVELLEAFAKEQKDTWGKKKSFELLHAVIGFRTGNPTVKKDKRYTWDGVLDQLKKVRLNLFVRKKEEVNKEAILLEKNEAILNQLKEDCGVYVEQDEAFFITPKIEEVK